jgi:YHS domain-containing protein
LFKEEEKMRIGKMLILMGSFFIVTQIATPARGEGEFGYHHDHGSSHTEKDPGDCPVMGAPASKDHSYTHEGKTYYFCCPWCIDVFKKDPGKYISGEE